MQMMGMGISLSWSMIEGECWRFFSALALLWIPGAFLVPLRFSGSLTHFRDDCAFPVPLRFSRALALFWFLDDFLVLLRFSGEFAHFWFNCAFPVLWRVFGALAHFPCLGAFLNPWRFSRSLTLFEIPGSR